MISCWYICTGYGIGTCILLVDAPVAVGDDDADAVDNDDDTAEIDDNGDVVDNDDNDDDVDGEEEDEDNGGDGRRAREFPPEETPAPKAEEPCCCFNG